MRLLVCGGRHFDNWSLVCAALDAVHRKHTVSLLIHGGATGADSLGVQWAELRGIPTRAYPADWKKYGRAAGPIRNQEMIDRGKPDAVVAFPGNGGTADMVERAKAAGIRPWEVAE